MTDTPSEPTTEQRDEVSFSQVRKSVDSYVVAPPVPYGGEFKPLMGAYEPAPDPQPSQPAPTSSAGEE
jgi:hypothetical protein